ncbi:MAG TPA: preprotein translocase subunit SecA, partial [Gemmatimonadales bacterium]|nr:preprotein translocase subunit SecA [Gemmatimonadales bacterium]
DAERREELKTQIEEFDKELRQKEAEILDELLPEAFAAVREASRRSIGLRHFDVQLIGGMVLHEGKISEMKTGEGKTLVATLPLYLNALTGRGVHLITVNDYLARRDVQWMGPIYHKLGLTCASIVHEESYLFDPTYITKDYRYLNLRPISRQEAYFADITYGTNNEFGFDYLRDNMVFSLEQRVQREHAYAIIDEVDSILIDEARTPLIISGPVGNESDEKYAQFSRQVAELVRKQTGVVNALLADAEKLLQDPKTRNDAALKLYQARLGMPKNKRLLKILNETGTKQLVQRMELDAIADRKLPMKQQRMRDLEETLYFVLDEKGHSVHLTDRGSEAMSPGEPTLFLVPDISEEIHAIDRDPDLSPSERIERRRQIESDYAIKSEKLHIIHKLLQAHVLYEKEVDYLVQEGQVMIVDEFTGRVMTGRRWADGLHQAVEAKEGVQVKGETQTFATITIQNYFRMYDKLAGMTGTAETEETEFYQIYGLDVNVIPTHRPIRRIDQADRIYKTRKEKHDAIMAEVERLHQLGWPILIGTVNVDVSETLSRQLKRRGLKHEVLNAKYHQREAEIVAGAGQREAIVIATNMAGRGTDIKLGKDLDLSSPEAGLQIIGTERHESRRIDRQLRGRSGRQGDPGQTIFFLSLEDDLMRLFGSDRIARWMDKSGAEEGEVITGGLVTRAIEQAQKRVELQNFQQRKRLLEYDDVMNQQREVIYSLRLFALERGEELKAEARRMIEMALERAVNQFLAGTERPEEYDRGGLRESLTLQYLVTVDAVVDPVATPTIDKMVEAARAEGEETFRRKIDYLANFGKTIGLPEVESQVLSQVMLSVLDERWKDHLYDLDQLRNAIQYRAWGQKDPLVEYKREAFEMFEDLMHDIQSTFTERFFKIQVSAEPAPPEPRARRAPVPAPAPPASAGSDDLFAPSPRRPAAAPPVAPSLNSSLGPVGRATAAVPEVGRNDPCPCGSGKKYKKCHGVGR